jgi:glycerophosphoryl diester phosphodiesterase
MIVLGHRGARARAPENTTLAFLRALADGACGSELDVRMTADAALVCLHDAMVDVGGALRRVCDATASEIARLEVHGPARVGRVASLEDALDALRDALAVVEIKNQPWDPCYDASLSIADAVAAALPAGAVIACFDPATLERAKSRAGGLRSAVITSASFDPRSNLEAAVAGAHEICSVEHTAIDAAFVDDAHAAEREVWAWATHDADRVRALAGMGVDALICDDPAAALAALRGP